MVIKTDSQNYTNIANAIRELNGSTTQYKPEEMTEAIDVLVPTEGIAYNTFDSSGNVLTATLYGNNLRGLAYNSKLTSVTLPANPTTILPCAFMMCSNLQLTSLPDSIVEIGNNAFSGCTNITLSKLPPNLTRITNRCFYNCTGLTNLTFPKDILYFYGAAFAYCTNLKTVTFQGTPKNIDSGIFLGCSSLTTINVPWSEGAVANAPWGATNATINYNYVE